jgi:hypothetical protein
VTVQHLHRAEVVPLRQDDRPPPDWVVEESVAVSVDDQGVWDPEEAVRVPAVVVRMPAHVARHLACVLDDWTTIGRILESARGTDERDLAGALHEAARVAEGMHRHAVP